MVTTDNESNLRTKHLSQTLLYRHIAYFMGKVVPAYVSITTSKDIMPCATEEKDFQLGIKHGRVV